MGFIKLNREVALNEIFIDNDLLAVYVKLVLGAKIYPENDNETCLERGQLKISVRAFAKKNGLSYQRTRSILKTLEETQFIKITGSRSFSIITIINYDCDEFFSNSATQQATQNQRTEQRTFNAPTLLNKKIKSFKKQEPPAQEQNLSDFERRALLVAEFGEVNVADYEQRFELWRSRQTHPVLVSCYDVIGRWLRADGVSKPRGKSFDSGGILGNMLDVYGGS